MGAGLRHISWPTDWESPWPIPGPDVPQKQPWWTCLPNLQEPHQDGTAAAHTRIPLAGNALLRSTWDLLAHAHFASSYPTRAPLARSTPGSPSLQLLQLQPCHQGNLNVQYPETLSSCLMYLQPDSQSYQAHTVDPEDIPIQGYSLKTVKGSCFVWFIKTKTGSQTKWRDERTR